MKDITGKRFNRLTAVKPIGRKNGGGFKWECMCDCGVSLSVLGGNLKNGHTKSCGCLLNEILEERAVHGLSKTRFYSIYRNMLNRCNNSNVKSFEIYGGRGIKCLWNSFEEFRNDMFDNYEIHIQLFGEKNTTIDRIDTNGDYFMGNCKWSTLSEQALNRRTVTRIVFEGNTKSISEWSVIQNIKYKTLYYRIKRGWSVERALSKA
jgi:hypothetical protein